MVNNKLKNSFICVFIYYVIFPLFNFMKNFTRLPHIRKLPINSLDFELLIDRNLHWEIRDLIGKIINLRSLPHKTNKIFIYLCTLISQNYARTIDYKTHAIWFLRLFSNKLYISLFGNSMDRASLSVQYKAVFIFIKSSRPISF